MRNVMGWNEALEAGFEPRLYPYTADKIIPAEYVVALDFKIWAKKTAGIACYFTDQPSGNKFQLTVYRQQGNGAYMLHGCEIDFSTCPVKILYRIRVDLNGKGNICFKHAITIQ